MNTLTAKAVSAEKQQLFGELEMLGRMAWMVTRLEVIVRSQLDALHEQEDG